MFYKFLHSKEIKLIKGQIAGFIEKAKQDWEYPYEIALKFDYRKTRDPTEIAYVLKGRTINYYIRNILGNFEISKHIKAHDFSYYNVLKYVTYHETGHLCQRCYNLIPKDISVKSPSIDTEESFEKWLLYSTYAEFTNEYSTMNLLRAHEGALSIKADIELRKYFARSITEPKMLWMLFQMYYPYFYAYKRLGKDYPLCQDFYEYIRHEMIEKLGKTLEHNGQKQMEDLLDNIEIIFDSIRLKKRGYCYYIERSEELDLNLLNCARAMWGLQESANVHAP